MINICTQTVKQWRPSLHTGEAKPAGTSFKHRSPVTKQSRNEITVIHPDSNPHDSQVFPGKTCWEKLYTMTEAVHFVFFFPFLTASQACARSAVIWVFFKRRVSTYTHQLEKKHYLSHRSKSCFWLSVTSPLSWKFKRWHRGCLYHLFIETRKKEKKNQRLKSPVCKTWQHILCLGWKFTSSK